MCKDLILFVDDDVDDQELFREALKHINCSFSLVCANNGAEALNQLHEMGNNIPAVIFTDSNMPKMNGNDFLRVLKEDECLKAIPVIAFSTSDNDDDRQHMLDLGAVQYIVKPHSFTRLCMDVKSALDRFSTRS